MGVYDTTRIYYKPILIMIGIFTFFGSFMTLSRISPSLEMKTGRNNQNNAQNGIINEQNNNNDDRKQIDKLMKLKSDDKTLNKLEKICKKLKDDNIKDKVENAIQEIKDVLNKNKSTKGGGGKK